MPRAPRVDVGGYVYHVLNRANARAQIFDEAADYVLFERILAECVEQFRVNGVSHHFSVYSAYYRLPVVASGSIICLTLNFVQHCASVTRSLEWFQRLYMP